MTFTYTPGAATDLDDIRSAIGDTVSTAKEAERLEDEEITRLLATSGSLAAAKIACARALLAKIARRATDRTIGGLRLSYAQRADALRDLIRDLESAITTAVAPYCGGISVADVEAVESQDDRVAPDFKSGMLDNPRGL
jgi:hypothetical protein